MTNKTSLYTAFADHNAATIARRWSDANGEGMGWGQESHTLAEAAADMGAIVLPGTFDAEGSLLCELSDRLYLLRDVNGPWAVEVATQEDLSA